MKNKLTDTPMPSVRKGAPRKYDFGKIKIKGKKDTKDTCLFIPNKTTSNIITCIHHFRKSNPDMTFTCKKTEGGVNVWRIS